MKKFCVMCLVFIIGACVLSGCGSRDPEQSGSAPPDSIATADESAPEAVSEVAAGSADQANDAPSQPGTVAAEASSSSKPQTAAADNDAVCHGTLAITCATILDHIDSFDQSKLEVLPDDGVVYRTADIEFTPGDTVFDVLLQATREEKIHMESVTSLVYDCSYIEGINNIYEFDCGELSGWMYKVNGVFPSFGCSKYVLKDGDRIEWLYTCDLGRDIGGDWNLQKNEQ